MRIAVIGVGAVGGYFGARLAADGNDVVFAARGRQRAAMAEKGLQVLSEAGDLLVEKPFLLDDPAAAGLCDIVLLCTKLWDLEAAAEAARPLLAHDSAVIGLQNGVEAVDIVSRVLGPDHAAGGVAYIGAEIAEPGVIRHTGKMAALAFGELDGKPSWRLEAFQAACEAAGFGAKLSFDIGQDIWKKFVMLTAFSGVTALRRAPIGPVLDDPEGRALFAQLVREAAAVARAKGIALAEDVEDKTIAQVERLPASMKSSLLSDLERGNRLELPWLSGAVARFGAELSVETPGHARVVEALTPYVDGK